jgi:hypothetical protein
MKNNMSLRKTCLSNLRCHIFQGTTLPPILDQSGVAERQLSQSHYAQLARAAIREVPASIVNGTQDIAKNDRLLNRNLRSKGQ